MSTDAAAQAVARDRSVDRRQAQPTLCRHSADNEFVCCAMAANRRKLDKSMR